MKEIRLLEESRKGKKVVFVSGNFNIIHPGHLRLLRFAKECGDILVVGVHDGKFEGALLAQELRLEGVKAISWVDYAFILHDSSSFIEIFKPDLVVKGKEHEEAFNPEADIVKEYGGKLIFGSGDLTFSSIDLMRQEWKELNYSTIKKPVDYLNRHGFTFNDMIETINSMANLRVCIVGDIIVDEYITCEALGMSQEDPTIVVSPVDQVKYIGGAGIVAAHVRSLGAKVRFFTVVGKDSTADYIEEMMKQYDINPHFYYDESRQTTLKQRYRSGNKTLLRVSHLRQHSINKELQDRLFEDFVSILDNKNLVIFSDFNYGCLPQQLVDRMVAECMKRNIMMVADSQSSSQIGNVSRFKNQTLITPTEREARISLHDYDSGLVSVAEKLRQITNSKNIILTLGSEGLLIHAEINDKNKLPTDRLPAMNTAPKDVAGAGDSLLVATSMAMALERSIWEAAYLGALAAACQVGRIGNIPLNSHELFLELKS
ncbi:MAG: ADP-heptose synthase [Spirochaetae bacterium HGW-Spirochaetae-5]|nr:MAG: ADP-heptose synthase [Spirochaetae bacterium HGW-Spirochaetae-5]